MNSREMPPGELVCRIFDECWNLMVYDCLAGTTADSMRFHYNGQTTTVTADSLPGLVQAWRDAFPDLEMRLRHLVVQDDLVAVSLTLHGTHRGTWLGITPTGRVVAVEEMMFFRFADGLLVEMWEVFDEQGLEHQLTH